MHFITAVNHGCSEILENGNLSIFSLAVNPMSAGFIHSAFALGYEAGINKCTIDGNLIPPGALVTFVQKGLQYLEMEANLSNVSMLCSFDSDMLCSFVSVQVFFFSAYLRIFCDQDFF